MGELPDSPLEIGKMLRVAASFAVGEKMKIHGFQKLTLLDYPGKVACTLFTGGCNFRCPFCQNAGLVLAPDKEPLIKQDEIMAVLKKRQGILEGICVTGGEPTLNEDLPEFLHTVKRMGYKVKLDTNGYRPQVLKQLVKEELVDYVAMDIKNCPEKYAATAGITYLDVDKIKESAEFLMRGSLEYEFRTTVCRELHQKADLLAIGKWLRGSKRYYLQPYRESPNVIRPVFTSYTKEQMHQFKNMLSHDIPWTEVRGMD
ncbi:MAG: anaerobic ribonucleoside-triphosphate reductase activating protein [Ruminococcus sp.]|jgi:pyruvate formate lyase activating enzyme